MEYPQTLRRHPTGGRMRRFAKALLWKWRRRHAAKRIQLQRLILGSEDMIGIDVGAAEGLQPHWWSFEGVARMYLFEPHGESANKLRSLYATSPYEYMFHVIPIGLGAATGIRDFYMLNAPTGSSLYPIDPTSEFAGPDNRYVHPIRATSVQVHKLSEVLDAQGLPRVDIAKLDVQGAELEVLQGLDSDRLSSLVLVEAEVNISGGITRTTSPYIGTPSWAALDEFFLSIGMRLLDLGVSRSHRAKDGDSDWYQREVFDAYANSPGVSAAAWEADVVYVRDYRLLIAAKNAAALRRLVVALCGYRFFSEAFFIVEQASSSGVFGIQDASAIQHAIVDWHRLTARRPSHSRNRFWRSWRAVLRRLHVGQYRRWKQYMWYDYPNG
jgi:FkbM family methyltransferase